MKTVVFCSFPDFAGNARSLYDYMKKKNKKSLNLYWVISDDNLYKELKQKGINVVKNDTPAMYKLMQRTDVFFTTHANLMDYKKQNSNALYVELWHGVSPKCIGHLINNMNNFEKNWFNKVNKKVDYLIVPSEFWKPIFAARFNLPPERVLPLGFPLFDNIINADGKVNLSRVLNLDVDKYNKIIYYMPTVISSSSRIDKISISNNIFNISEYKEEILLKYLEDNNYLLCIKYHPSEKTNFKKIDSPYVKYIEESEMLKYKLDTNMILNAADLLITNYSSVGLHYLMLERPVVYLKKDIKEFANSRGIIFDNYEFWTDDEVAADINTLINKISDNLKQANLDRIKKKKRLLFGDKENGGCKEIYSAIFNSNGELKLKSFVNEEERLLKENIELKRDKESYFIELTAIKNSRSYIYAQKLKRLLGRVKK